MKKALMLAGLFLCGSLVYAQEAQVSTVADGRKRNEEVYERMLEETGWKNETTPPTEQGRPQQSHQDAKSSSQSKSS